MKDIFNNYETFYNMLVSTTIMSNTKTPECDADMEKIIEFIGKAYRLDDDLIAKCKDLILNKLSLLGLTTDQQAIYSARRYGEAYSDENVLFDIKGDVLNKIQNICQETKNADINDGWYDYSHYKTYQPAVRASKIAITSGCGNILATRQMGILYALGLGVKRSLEDAIARLTQCMYWGDIPATYYLSFVYSLVGNDDEAKTYSEVATLLTKHLSMGVTIIPNEEYKTFSKKAIVIYSYISSIKQDIVYAYKHFDIDFSFIEALLLPDLSEEKRMYFINNYEKKEWKELTNNYHYRSKIGF